MAQHANVVVRSANVVVRGVNLVVRNVNLVARNVNLVARNANLVARDANLVARDVSLVARDVSLVALAEQFLRGTGEFPRPGPPCTPASWDIRAAPGARDLRERALVPSHSGGAGSTKSLEAESVSWRR